MKFMLAVLFAFTFNTSVSAQEQAPNSSGPKCLPFDRVYQKLEENGFAPVFLGENNNQVNLAIVKNKTNNWMLLKFIKQGDGKIIACMLTEGNEGIILQEEHISHKEGT